MDIAFRVDASNEIGTGHLMRCVTLANEMATKGARSSFLCRSLPEALKESLLKNNHIIVMMIGHEENSDLGDLDHSHWLGVSQDFDSRETVKYLELHSFDLLIVDHYGIDCEWEKKVKPLVKELFVIDDLADRQHECDILLDQNFYSDMGERYQNLVPSRCKALLGPKYSLLREEFSQIKKDKDRTVVDRILIFFGGVDLENHTLLAMKSVQSIIANYGYALNVDVVIGQMHPNRIDIISHCEKFGFNCHIQTNAISSIMADADLAIGAGGSATWERCSLGLTSIAWSIAENQNQLINDAAKAGIIYSIDEKKLTIDYLATHLLAVIDNTALRELIARNGKKVVDTYGLSRVCSFLNNTCSVRKAEYKDCRDIFNWRNDATVRLMSGNTELISWPDHQAWYSSSINDEKKILLIVSEKDEPAGVVRFDLDGLMVEVSIYLVPAAQGKGLGLSVLIAAEHWLKNQREDIEFIEARVMSGNEASHDLFNKSGYTQVSSLYTKRLSDA